MRLRPIFIIPISTLKKNSSGAKAVFLDFSAAQGVLAHIPEYNPSEYANVVLDGQNPGRCNNCWELRLKKTAEFAIVNNFAYFTTALLVSPYQDIEAIKRIGEGMSVKFLFRDFRPGFRQAHTRARAMGIYCQKYCGCSYSLEEREAIKKCRTWALLERHWFLSGQ